MCWPRCVPKSAQITLLCYHLLKLEGAHEAVYRGKSTTVEVSHWPSSVVYANSYKYAGGRVSISCTPSRVLIFYNVHPVPGLITHNMPHFCIRGVDIVDSGVFIRIVVCISCFKSRSPVTTAIPTKRDVFFRECLHDPNLALFMFSFSTVHMATG